MCKAWEVSTLSGTGQALLLGYVHGHLLASQPSQKAVCPRAQPPPQGISPETATKQGSEGAGLHGQGHLA